MKILTRKEQDEILKSVIQLIGEMSGMMTEGAADCIMEIIHHVAGDRGLAEVAETTMEQAKLFILSLHEINRLQNMQEDDKMDP